MSILPFFERKGAAMNYANASVPSAVNELAKQFLAVPPGSRRSIMQSVAALRTHESIDEALKSVTFALHLL